MLSKALVSETVFASCVVALSSGQLVAADQICLCVGAGARLPMCYQGKFVPRISDVKCSGSLVNINTLTCILIKTTNCPV